MEDRYCRAVFVFCFPLSFGGDNVQTYIDRLVKAGIPLACADEIVSSFWADGDLNGLRRYISLIENGYTVCMEGGKVFV